MPVTSTTAIDDMLPFVIAVSKDRDIETIHEHGLEPLDARSLALSVLLGSHPPVLPARALVALAELFGIAGGTMRTALSRMTAAGELDAADGRYRLAGRLLERQRAQDVGRRQPDRTWDGEWHTVIAATDQRELADRRRFRSAMANHRFGELRPDIWMRPANLPVPSPAPDWIVTTGPIAGIDPADLRDRLWDLGALHARGTALLATVDRLMSATDWSDPDSIPDVFVASAAVVRYLRDEPLLPAQLAPPDWPADRLRPGYDALERQFQVLLRAFFAAPG
jgi:phenylacetic acid degradation operon negative regulatory protein